MAWQRRGSGRKQLIWMLVAAALLFLGPSASPAFADFISSTLGAAGPADWAILETGGGNLGLANASNAGFVTGNVGVVGTSPGSFSDSGVPLSGNFVGSSSAILPSVPPTEVTGTITTNAAELTAAVSAAETASTTFAALAATLTNASITGTTTINLLAGVNVADLSTVNLGGGQVLTLNGAAGDEVILNVTNGVTLNSGKIVLTGGLTAADVVFNVLGGNVSTAGGLNNESVLTGVFLDLNGNEQITPGAVTGELIGGKTINIASGGSIAGVPASTPEPASLPLIGSLLVCLGLIRYRRRQA